VGDGDAAEQPPELLVVADGEEQVPRDDPGLLVVARRVAGELQNLQRKAQSARLLERGAADGKRGRRVGLASAARYSRTAAR
jgi:hypothetical protein